MEDIYNPGNPNNVSFFKKLLLLLAYIFIFVAMLQDRWNLFPDRY